MRKPKEASAASLSSRLSTWARSLAARQRMSLLALSMFLRNCSGVRDPPASQEKPSRIVTAPATIRPGIRNSCTMWRPDGGGPGGGPGRWRFGGHTALSRGARGESKLNGLAVRCILAQDQTETEHGDNDRPHYQD